MSERRFGDPLPLGALLHARGLLPQVLDTPIVLLIIKPPTELKRTPPPETI